MNNLAPIVLFTYNRLNHTKKTIEALQNNELATKSTLFIYSDGYTDNEQKEKVKEVRKYLKRISGFKNITIIKQKENLGLAKSIILGVTDIINKYGKIIVLEDDIVTSPYFLNYMNDSLNFYEKEKHVWHISAWNYPIEETNNGKTYLWRVMNCWGWGTWKNKWSSYEKNTDELISSFNKEDIYKFNLDGTYDFWGQVLANQSKTINTWAIYWYATIFKNQGLCVNPTKSFTKNIGFDKYGTHTKGDKPFNEILINSYPIHFEKKIFENKTYLNKMKLFYILQKDRTNYFNFNKILGSIYLELNKLSEKDEKFIIYGAGSGSKLISDIIGKQVSFIVDKNYNISKNIYPLKKLKSINERIIISVFGREYEIVSFLINKYNINIDKFIILGNLY